jgi:alginate O-acetyltransferase complex protein AlgI
MIFPTIEFAAFFLVVLPLSWLLMPRPAMWKPFILAASYFFYGYADIRFVLLLAASTAVNQIAAKLLARRHDGRILAAAIVIDLGLLGWFKYYGFFSLAVATTLDRIGLSTPLPLLQVTLPVGISFFTFQAMSYIIDVYRGRTEVARTIDVAVYEAFFPHLVAGPIVRASEFLPQLSSPRDPRRIEATRALFLIAGGYFKKVVLADLIGTKIVDPVWATPGQHSSMEVLVAIYGYAVEIYCDFSAYSEMAIGLALLLGFRFPDNFDRPYAATSLREFWRRWHMTLSRWLRDYLYVPLGGSRRGNRRTYVNLMITMLLGGLWHGAAWTFVLWGAMHGTGLAGERWWSRRRRPAHAGRPAPVGATSMPLPRPVPDAATDPVPAPGPVPAPTPLSPGAVPASGPAPAPGRGAEAAAAGTRLDARMAPSIVGDRQVDGPGLGRRWLARVAVFHFVCVAWVLFRSPDLATAGQIFRRLLSGFGPSPLVTPGVVAAIALGLATQAVPRHWWFTARIAFGRLPLLGQAGAFVAFFLLCHALVGDQGVAPFIYFRF